MNTRIIIVTGGAGFIGSHLCDVLLARGCKVIAVDNLFSGSKKNIAHLLQHSHFTFINSDITAPFFISGRVDEIYNLACPASPVWYQKDPVKTIRTSVFGTANMLELARKKKATFLQASTSEVYGDPLEHPQKESYWGNVNLLGPRACYDEGKRCAETLCMNYRRQYGMPVKIVRIFNTYGPRMAENDGRVVSNFIVQALRGEPLTMYGNGMQTRSFQYVSDLIDGMIHMMKMNDFSGPVNLGNPEEFTIVELAKKILALTGSKSRIVHVPLPEDDPRQRQPDITLANNRLGWMPKVSLGEGLKKTTAYFSTNISG